MSPGTHHDPLSLAIRDAVAEALAPLQVQLDRLRAELAKRPQIIYQSAPQPLAYSRCDAAGACGMSTSNFDREVRDGTIRQSGRRKGIYSAAELQSYLDETLHEAVRSPSRQKESTA